MLRRSSRVLPVERAKRKWSLVEQHLVAANLFNAARQTVAMHRPHDGKSLEHHEIESALK